MQQNKQCGHTGEREPSPHPQPPVLLPYSPHIPGYFQVYQASLTTRHDQLPFFFHWHRNHSKFHSIYPKKILSSPKCQHLHYWGCHDFLAALNAYPNATVAYTDGSDDSTVDTPSDAAVTFNTTPPTTICNISPIKGSCPAETYAIILFTHLPHINTFSHPIICAIDNLSVRSTLHQIQHLNAKPFASNANCLALWYNYIPNFLHNTHLHINFTWIKEHADFVGNEHSDKISK